MTSTRVSHTQSLSHDDADTKRCRLQLKCWSDSYICRSLARRCDNSSCSHNKPLTQSPNKLTNTKLARRPVIVVYIITDSGLVVNHGVISSQLLAVNVCTSKYVADYYSTSDEKWLLWPGQQLSLSTVNTVQYNRCISVTVSSRTMMQSSRPGQALASNNLQANFLALASEPMAWKVHALALRLWTLDFGVHYITGFCIHANTVVLFTLIYFVVWHHLDLSMN